LDKIALVAERIEAGARFLIEFNNYRPIAVAFWLGEEEASDWYLYVVS